MRKLSIYFVAIALALLFSACKGKTDVPADNTGAAKETAAEESEGPTAEYKDQKIGDYSVSVKQFGKISPGKEVCFIISVSGGDILALRAWMGDEDATGSAKTKATKQSSGKYDVDMEIPTGGGMLWLEIEGKNSKISGAIEVK